MWQGIHCPVSQNLKNLKIALSPAALRSPTLNVSVHSSMALVDYISRGLIISSTGYPPHTWLNIIGDQQSAIAN